MIVPLSGPGRWWCPGTWMTPLQSQCCSWWWVEESRGGRTGSSSLQGEEQWGDSTTLRSSSCWSYGCWVCIFPASQSAACPVRKLLIHWQTEVGTFYQLQFWRLCHIMYNATCIHISVNSAVELLSRNTALILNHKSTLIASAFKCLIRVCFLWAPLKISAFFRLFFCYLERLCLYNRESSLTVTRIIWTGGPFAN